jgi:hypothetical protein
MSSEQSALVARLYQQAGFSEDDARSIKKRPYTDYAQQMLELAPTFEVLAKPQLPHGSIKAISETKGVPYGTIRDWRTKLLHDPEWRPYSNRNQHLRALSPEQEDELVRQIKEQYISPGFYCPPKVCQILANRIYGGAVPEKIAWDSDGHEDSDPGIPESEDESEDESGEKRKTTRRKPRFTRHWRQQFLRRNNLSLRRPHTRRRPTVSDEAVATFLADVDTAFAEYGRRNIYNLDETHWALINAREITIAPRGQEGVAVNFSGDPKMGITVIAIISAAGEKMPLWVICKGTSERCEKRFREHFASQIRGHQLMVCHQISGWTDKVISKTVLRWVSERNNNAPKCLLWDVYSAHREEGVKGYAARKGTKLIYIPPGMTDEYQPLDRRVFGSLKARARARFDEQWIRNPGTAITLESAIEILLEVWKSMPQDEIIDAWSRLDPDPIGE